MAAGPFVTIWIWVVLGLRRLLYCERETETTSFSTYGSAMKEGDAISFSCETEGRGFVCLWLSPSGTRFCSIQENENGPNRVCKESQGDQRIKIKSRGNQFGIIINNVTKADQGQWLCLVDDGQISTDKRLILRL